MTNASISAPKSWLAFDLNILRRYTAASLALPLLDDPALGLYMKRAGVRIAANDPFRSNWARSVAVLQNNSEKLTDEDVNLVLEDAYVPGYKLQNPSLLNWFSETDSWWFDNVRRNIEKLTSPTANAIAASIAMAAGDYVRSFTEETRQLRQPLSNVFRRLWMVQPEPVNNGQNNACHNKQPDEFIAQTQAEMMFLRLPSTAGLGEPRFAWREEWLRGESGFWNEINDARLGRLGSPVETRSQYLNLLSQTLERAAHFPLWAIAHVEDGFVTTQDIIETIGTIRRVEAVYTKDFSELTGSKAVIITA